MLMQDIWVKRQEKGFMIIQNESLGFLFENDQDKVYIFINKCFLTEQYKNINVYLVELSNQHLDFYCLTTFQLK
jgi:hypothetical protein